ncbi:MAG: aminodeoxychorismate/anthranilate synthase component II [Phycisphaerales bacterium]|nr:MAG: aminodeoxychorismate/anthranilate synthase component II [Phycisphaerales bacterium]
MILVIDNYDSFTWNLVHRLGELDPSLRLGEDLVVVRNDKMIPAEAERLRGGLGPSRLIVSPGPCTPREAGESGAFIERFAGRIPILGVCLGHQCIADRHAMPVIRHNVLMHGKTSPIHHDAQGVFANLPQPFTATRYHSLVVPVEAVPEPPATDAAGRPLADGWAVSAWTDEPAPGGGTQRVVMGLRRVWRDPAKAPLEGVQFHPESFLTDEGPSLLRNFLNMPSAAPTAQDAMSPARSAPRPEPA